MEYKFAVHTDVGIQKETNQDSCCIKVAETTDGKILLAVICDGMGGLEKGEVASATLIKTFSNWFEADLPVLLSHNGTLEDIRYQWDRIIKEQNSNISEYGKLNKLQLGTTVTALIILEDGHYLIGHVGDSRAYKITNDGIEVITEDQTVVAREIKQGRMTPEQAEKDPRKNVLLQCVGASRIVEPAFYYGEIEREQCYMLCSDGFRHVVRIDEIHKAFLPEDNLDEGTMKSNIVELVELNKFRHETDNITAVLIRSV